MRQDRGSRAEVRSSALWGRGGRYLAATLGLVFAFAAPPAATAEPGKDNGGGNDITAFVTPTLLAAVHATPDAAFQVIVQGEDGKSSDAVAADVAAELAQGAGKGTALTRRFATISGVAAELTGKQILKLATKKGIFAITEDAPVALSNYSNSQVWPFAAGVNGSWKAAVRGVPTIAIVDSGIDASRADFGGRVVAQVNMTSLTPNSPGDGRGHGTLVAGIAAGGADGYTGAAPRAQIVSIDVMDDRGMARTSDVIAAADWIYQNKPAYGIRVANFSLHSSLPSTFMYDPLDKAVEKLWFSGVVVVAAAGNYAADGLPSGVLYGPGNDPFVITVGAADVNNTSSTSDDFAAPWSAYGYTLDGFAKPELLAPGRRLIGPVTSTSTMALERPERIVAPGYMWMSGTSFAAPVVAGAAAYLLAVNPGWTPDQVKGALMLTAKPLAVANDLADGVGTIFASEGAKVSGPPNPNLALNRFLVADPAGGSVPVFDAASWASAALADASWASASWASASWASASWSSASWASASWSSASWASASWASASWASASWADASWSSAGWASASWVE